MVRLQPDLLAILDRWADETGASRPEALRTAFLQWAASAGFLPTEQPRIPERPLMVILRKDLLAAAVEATGESDPSDAVERLVHDHLTGLGYLKAE